MSLCKFKSVNKQPLFLFPYFGSLSQPAINQNPHHHLVWAQINKCLLLPLKPY